MIDTQNISFTQSINSVNQSLNGNVLIAEGRGAATKYYIQAGADTASKKLLGKQLIYVGTSNMNPNYANFNCTSIPGWKNLKASDFIIIFSSVNVVGNAQMPEQNCSVWINSYNDTTGILVVSPTHWVDSPRWSVGIIVNIYVLA